VGVADSALANLADVLDALGRGDDADTPTGDSRPANPPTPRPVTARPPSRH